MVGRARPHPLRGDEDRRRGGGRCVVHADRRPGGGATAADAARRRRHLVRGDRRRHGVGHGRRPAQWAVPPDRIRARSRRSIRPGCRSPRTHAGRGPPRRGAQTGQGAADHRPAVGHVRTTPVARPVVHGGSDQGVHRRRFGPTARVRRPTATRRLGSGSSRRAPGPCGHSPAAVRPEVAGPGAGPGLDRGRPLRAGLDGRRAGPGAGRRRARCDTPGRRGGGRTGGHSSSGPPWTRIVEVRLGIWWRTWTTAAI